jgi:methionyl-tRNA formyltransferase
MRIVFFGTPAFAAVSLSALIEAGHEIVGVVSQPDRPKGRHGEIVPSPVKVLAQTHRISLWQPDKGAEASLVTPIAAVVPEVIVVVAYGAILPQKILVIPRRGAYNLHASLLPKYRGASPVSAAILAGEEETGITFMRMVPRMDAGPILAQQVIKIHPTENAGELMERLAPLGAQLLQETLNQVVTGRVSEIPQEESQATYCKTLTKEDGQIPWNHPAVYLERFVRAMNPWPGAYTFWQKQGKPAERIRLSIQQACTVTHCSTETPGTVVQSDRHGIWVATLMHCLNILQLQRAGKISLDAQSFLQGTSITPGDRLLSEESA